MKYLQIKTDAQGTLDDVQVKRAEADKNGNDISETYALLHNEYGGFNAGDSATSGSGGGAAIGMGATSTNGGGACGNNTTASAGGGAIGDGAKTNGGFAGGKQAISSGSGSVQLGTGMNNTANTLQFRSYPLVDVNGHIPTDRLDGTYDISVSYATQANSAGTATTAATATQATRAIGDGNGNNIANTYVKKSALKYQHNLHISIDGGNNTVYFSVLLRTSTSYEESSARQLINDIHNIYNNATLPATGNVGTSNVGCCTSIWMSNVTTIGFNFVSGDKMTGSYTRSSSALEIIRDMVVPVAN